MRREILSLKLLVLAFLLNIFVLNKNLWEKFYLLVCFQVGLGWKTELFQPKSSKNQLFPVTAHPGAHRPYSGGAWITPGGIQVYFCALGSQGHSTQFSTCNHLFLLLFWCFLPWNLFWDLEHNFSFM